MGRSAQFAPASPLAALLFAASLVLAVAVGLAIEFIFAAFSLMTVILRPVVGAALDRYGRRPFFLLGLAGYAATMFAFAVMDQVSGIVLARILIAQRRLDEATSLLQRLLNATEAGSRTTRMIEMRLPVP